MSGGGDLRNSGLRRRGVAKRLRHRTLTPTGASSNLATPAKWRYSHFSFSFSCVKRFLERGKTDKRSVLAHGIRSAIT